MKFDNITEEQEVFRFINSNQCDRLSCLLDFLKGKKLPLNERWAFYFLGRKGYINEERIDNMDSHGFKDYGKFIFAEIYYWVKYLKSEEEFKNNHIMNYYREPKLDEFGSIINIDDLWLNEYFVMTGYEFVKERMDLDSIREDDFYGNLLQESILKNHSGSIDTYCEACESDPCRCSK